MLDAKVMKLLDEQYNKELYSSYLYLKIADYYNDLTLMGYANWFNVQAKEELDHAMLMLQYMQNNSGRATFAQVNAVEDTFTGIKEPLEAALDHEKFITASINTIYDAAYTLKDYRTMQFLDWFIKEQGEEETNADTLIKKTELFGTDSKGLYMLDNELATRTYAPPSLVL